MMDLLIEQLYVITSVVMGIAGLIMVGFALNAFRQTGRRSFVHLAVGFTLVVGATAGSTFSAFLLDFSGLPFILAVHNALTAAGFLFVIISLTINRRSGETKEQTDRAVASD